MKARLLFEGKVEASVDDGDFAEHEGHLDFDGKRVVFKNVVRVSLDMRHKRAKVVVDGKELGMFMDHVEFQGKELAVVEVEYHNPLKVVDAKEQEKKAVEVKPDHEKSRKELEEKRAALRKQEADRKAKEIIEKKDQTKEFNATPSTEK